jgi:phage terminase large subunit
MELELPYHPRKQFIPFHQRSTRFAAMCCHRRMGKTVACVGELVTRGMYTTKKRAEYAYIGPFRSQAKKIAWAYLKDFTEGLRKGPPRESDLSVTLHTGATITLYGADNPDSLRGIYLDGVVLDEYGDMRPSLWGEIILACLLDRNGWAVFIGTMRGKNHFYQVLERAKKEDNWHHLVMKASESGLLSPDQLKEARAEMTESQYQQEMECDPNAAVQGTYYSNLIAKMETDGMIGNFPYDPDEMVHVSADLGFTDSTAFWFWQMTKAGPQIIDYEEHDSEPLQFYFDLLNGKGYEYAEIWLPHDAKASTLQTGRSTIEQFVDPKGDGSRKGGFPARVVPKLAVQHGIDAARLILPQCRINKGTCSNGIEALRAYRRQFNEKTQQFSNTPLHDWASNGADSFRYMALVTETTKKMVDVVEPLHNQLKAPEYTLDDLFAANEEERTWRSKIIRI